MSRTFYTDDHDGFRALCDDYTKLDYGTPLALTRNQHSIATMPLGEWADLNRNRFSCWPDEPAVNVIAKAQQHGEWVFVIYAAEAAEPFFGDPV